MSSATKPRVYVNGFPLMVMQSIRSRQAEGLLLADAEIDIDGATAYEIENDLETASGFRPAAGSVFSALDTLIQHGHVVRFLTMIERRETRVHFLTPQGEERLTWFLSAVGRAGAFKPVGGRGPRVSARGRPRRRRKRNGEAS